jgi:hypothetical protein
MKRKILVLLVLAALIYGGARFSQAVDYSGYLQTYKQQHWEIPLNAFITAVQNDITSLGSAVTNLGSTVTSLGNQVANWVGTVDSLTLIQTAPAYSDASTFTLAADYSAVLTAGKRIVADCGADGLKPNTVVSCTYGAPNSTVVVTTANLTANLAAMSYYATRNGLNTYGSGDVVAAEYGSPTWANLQSAAAVANAAGRRLLLTPGAWPVSGDLTITAPVHVVPGASFAVATTKTLTLNGPVDAGPYQIITLTGTGAVALNGAQDKAYSAWFPGADIGAKLNNAVAAMGATTTVPIIVTADEWCGESYAAGIVVNKPVWIQFPGIRNGAAVYTGATAGCKLTVNGARITGFHVDLTGNTNTGVDGLVIYGASDCLIDGGIRVQYSTAGGGAVRRWLSIDGATAGAYNNVINGVTRLEGPAVTAATSGAFLWLGTSGAGYPNANQIQHVITSGKVPDAGYGVVFNAGLNNHIGQLYVNSSGATAWCIWVESTVGSYQHYIGTCTLDASVLGGGIKMDAGSLTFGQLFNNVAGTATTIGASATLSYGAAGGLFADYLSTKYINLQNVTTANKVSATGVIYGSNSGASYPYAELGNLIISPRTSVGAPRDIVFVTGNPPVTVAAITRLGAIRGLLATNGPVGTFTLDAAAETTITNTIVTASSIIQVFPTNAAAATLMGSAKSLYISARTANTSFKVKTADASAAAGTETFNYLVLN